MLSWGYRRQAEQEMMLFLIPRREAPHRNPPSVGRHAHAVTEDRLWFGRPLECPAILGEEQREWDL